MRDGGMLDRFGVVLLFIVASLFAATLRSTSEAWTVIVILLQGATLTAALMASGAPRWMGRVAIGVTIAGIVGATLGAYLGQGGLATDAGNILIALLAALAPVAIGWRLVHHDHVSAPTIAGALCIYLLLGLFFSVLYGIADHLISGGALTGQLNRGSVDYVYFSFITMATVGYGDITPRADLVRMLAVSQSLFGQLYLVTVVALLVGRIQPKRRRPDVGVDEERTPGA